MKLGDFTFSLDTAAYDELRRSYGYEWAEQPRVGGVPALQFTGRKCETITLQGLIYPHFRGGLGQIKAMRREAEKAKPLLLVDGRGFVLGQWVIEGIDESQSLLWANGVPRKIAFSLQLKKFSEDRL